MEQPIYPPTGGCTQSNVSILLKRGNSFVLGSGPGPQVVLAIHSRVDVNSGKGNAKRVQDRQDCSCTGRGRTLLGE